jgi:hypothetical protein
MPEAPCKRRGPSPDRHRRFYRDRILQHHRVAGHVFDEPSPDISIKGTYVRRGRSPVRARSFASAAGRNGVRRDRPGSGGFNPGLDGRTGAAYPWRVRPASSRPAVQHSNTATRQAASGSSDRYRPVTCPNDLERPCRQEIASRGSLPENGPVASLAGSVQNPARSAASLSMRGWSATSACRGSGTSVVRS